MPDYPEFTPWDQHNATMKAVRRLAAIQASLDALRCVHGYVGTEMHPGAPDAVRIEYVALCDTWRQVYADLTREVLNDVERCCHATAVYPQAGHGTPASAAYVALGMSGEAGEVANKAKKVLRGDFDRNPEGRQEHYKAIRGEIGDTFWYAFVAPAEFGGSAAACIMDMLAKLKDRARRDVIKGSGDQR